VKKAGIGRLGIAVAPRLHHYTQKRLLAGAKAQISCEVIGYENSGDSTDKKVTANCAP